MQYWSLLIIVFALLVIQLADSRTITQHYSTNIDQHELANDPIRNQLTAQQFSTIQLKPQTETIEIGGTNMPMEMLISQAEAAGMDKVAITELLRTKQPVITTKTNVDGQIRTTTYKLTADGSISSQTVIEPSTILHTTSNTKFEQPQTSLKTVAEPIESTAKQPDWEWTSAPRNNGHTYSGQRPFDFDNTGFISTPKNWLNFDHIFERRTTTDATIPDSPTITTIPKWKSTTNFWDSDKFAPDWLNKKPTFEVPEGVTPRTTTKTEVDDEGNKITTTLTTYSSGPVVSNQWSTSVKYPSIFEEHVDETINNPNILNPTVVHHPKPIIVPTTPLPSLNEFLKQHYATSTTTKYPSFLSPGVSTTTEKPTININLDDLPTTDTTPGKPLYDEKWLHTLNIPTNDIEKSETSIKTFHKNIYSSNLPTNDDLDPNMRAVLQRAGISADDIKNSNGESITKTRVEPDGRIIKTTYNVRTIPRTVDGTTPTKTFGDSVTTYNYHSPSSTNIEFENIPTDKQFDFGFRKQIPTTQYNYSHKQDRTNFPMPIPTTTVKPSIAALPPSNINEFLSKVDLSPTQILAQNGEVVKTFVDADGNVLSATFVLSTVKGDKSKDKQQTMPEPKK